MDIQEKIDKHLNEKRSQQIDVGVDVVLRIDISLYDDPDTDEEVEFKEADKKAKKFINLIKKLKMKGVKVRIIELTGNDLQV